MSNVQRKFPLTPLVELFRDLPTGRGAQARRLEQLESFIEKPAELAELFASSVDMVEGEFSSSQPFYPVAHRFGCKPDGTPHGKRLTATVDVAARLARKPQWCVEGDPRLD